VSLPAIASARAKHKLDVHPGNDALAQALERARDGDVLRIHGRQYREAVTIDERVKLVGVARRRPVIDARCGSDIAIAVRADGVQLKRLEVRGAEGDRFPSEVDFNGVSNGRASNLVVRDTCDAEYGINVFKPARSRSSTAARSGSTTPGSTSGASRAPRAGQSACGRASR
jgi:hypothetical protein